MAIRTGDSRLLGNRITTFHRATTTPIGTYNHMPIDHCGIGEMQSAMRCSSNRCCMIWSGWDWRPTYHQNSSHLLKQMGISTPLTNFLIEQLMLNLNRRNMSRSNRSQQASHLIRASDSITSDNQSQKSRRYLRTHPSPISPISCPVVMGRIYLRRHGCLWTIMHRGMATRNVYNPAMTI